MEFNTLYKKNNNGVLTFWEAVESMDGYEIRYGLVGGSVIVKPIKVVEGKAGREIDEQTYLEMHARYTRKLRAGFLEDQQTAMLKKENVNPEGFKLPMLATKERSSFNEGSLVQYKFDGLRFLVTKKDGQLKCYSKTGIEFPYMPHIMDDMELDEGQTVDGEIYSHRVPLQTINSMVKTPQPSTLELRYQVYDLITDDYFSKRIAMLGEMSLGSNCIITPTYDTTDIEDRFKEAKHEGYEGLIVRQNGYNYQVGKRCPAMFKMKSFLTDEAIVIDIVETEKGVGLFICQLDNGKEFKLRCHGTIDENLDILENKHLHIGKYVEYKYAHLTLAGKPAQSVALHFREWE